MYISLTSVGRFCFDCSEIHCKPTKIWRETQLVFLCLQISECSSQQIQGLSSLRSSLGTMSIHRSTETMMVNFISHTIVFSFRLYIVCSVLMCILMLTLFFSRSWSRNQANSHSGNLRVQSLVVPSLLLSLCGET